MHTLSGKPQGRHVVIVDDLVQTGGTLIQCAKVRGSLLPSVLLSVLCIMHVANVWLSNSWPRRIPSLVAGCPSHVLCVLFTEVAGQNLGQKAWVVGTYEARAIFSQQKVLLTITSLLLSFQALRAHGAATISLFVTHAVFPQESWRRFTEPGAEFANFWITDSIPHAVSIAQNTPFKLLSLCDSIADSLLGYDLLSCNQ